MIAVVTTTTTTTNNNTTIIITIITNIFPIMTKVLAINVQQLITGYGIGFSAPCLAQLVIFIDMVNTMIIMAIKVIIMIEINGLF